MAETEIERKFENFTLRLGSIDTKLRINEQNLLNLQNRVQLLSKNLLDLKKETRGELDSLSNKTEKIKEDLDKLSLKIKGSESYLVNASIDKKIEQLKAFQKKFLTPNLTKEEAEKILDATLKILEDINGSNQKKKTKKTTV